MTSKRSKRDRRWFSRHDKGHGLRLEIGDLARAAAGPGWSRLAVRRAQVGSHAVTTVTRDGREIAAEGLEEPFQRLRELSRRAEAGTWFVCELEFTPGSRGYTGRVDSTAPPFEEVPPAAALAELTTYPCLEPPAWLPAALPTAPPLGLPDPDDHRWGRPFDDRPPPRPPITGELSYVPATAMTARFLGHDQRDGGRMVCLAERADDRTCEFFHVSCHGQAYWVGRQDRSGTGEGVRSLTLDEGRLRVELTPEAADTLRTETVFEIHLDLPPRTIDELRAALPGTLRPAAEAPELIGF